MDVRKFLSFKTDAPGESGSWRIVGRTENSGKERQKWPSDLCLRSPYGRECFVRSRKGVIDLIPREKLWGKADVNTSWPVLCLCYAGNGILSKRDFEYLDNFVFYYLREREREREMHK